MKLKENIRVEQKDFREWEVFWVTPEDAIEFLCLKISEREIGFHVECY
jgi:hypothetical protein